jgi:hypothetical protein
VEKKAAFKEMLDARKKIKVGEAEFAAAKAKLVALEMNEKLAEAQK